MQLPEQPGTEPRPGNKPLFYWGGAGQRPGHRHPESLCYPALVLPLATTVLQEGVLALSQCVWGAGGHPR